MHMIFGPSDARTVIEKGWGERHPLSGVYPGLPVTYLMIYAPRDQEEVAMVVCRRRSSRSKPKSTAPISATSNAVRGTRRS